ncbi:MAG TPA: hypothetical protein VJ246_02465 [Patescibacteria group bacterium]|nr:hypothetical protein [Patescibacteria group bacterium]
MNQKQVTFFILSSELCISISAGWVAALFVTPAFSSIFSYKAIRIIVTDVCFSCIFFYLAYIIRLKGATHV